MKPNGSTTMTERALDEALRELLRQCGYERLDRALKRIGRAARRGENGRQVASSPRTGAPRRRRKSRPKPTATGYVSKMDLPDGHRRLLAEAAEKFHEKAFLPTVGDVRNFCEIHGVGASSSGSRADAVPRVFKLLATMNLDDLRRTLDSGMFSGPARLGPIADAIRDAGRSRTLERMSRDEGLSEEGRRREPDAGLAVRAD